MHAACWRSAQVTEDQLSLALPQACAKSSFAECHCYLPQVSQCRLGSLIDGRTRSLPFLGRHRKLGGPRELDCRPRIGGGVVDAAAGESRVEMFEC
jgi:hypothetical protein